MANRFLIGATYYPEHWPAENHARDLDRVASAGFNVVRLGEGAWWYWEPREREYQFDLFDRVIDLCREREIKVVMGTPTYTGPAWISSKYPEVLRKNFERQPLAHGSRQNFNHTSPKFRDLSRRITSALANHYANENQIVAWQLDNEINNGNDASYAESDTVAFRAWLRERYGTLDALNDSWGTRFWSQIYDDWEQIDLPAPTAQGQNPHRLLDQSRFISDSVIAFVREQAEILRAANPRWQVTHNSIFGNVNPRHLAAELDFYSLDHYPLFWKHWWEFAQKPMEARSYSFPFSIMEQQSGPGGQMSYLLRTPEPGEQRLWTYQSIAHGADKLLYFTWRTCPFGTEQHWHGLIDQDNKDTRRLREAAETAKEIATLPDEFFDAKPVKVAAVLRDFDIDVNEKRINTYTGDGRWAFGRWAAALLKRHVPTDFVWTDEDFDGYQLLVAGHVKIVDEALVTKLTRFVGKGGTLVLGAQSGLHDRRLHIVQRTPPGPLAELAGVEVADWTVLEKSLTRKFAIEDGPAIGAFALAERLRPTTSTLVASWSHGSLYRGSSAVTALAHGAGQVIYIGAYTDLAATEELTKLVMHAAKIAPAIDASENIEYVSRRGASHDFIVILNHGPGAASLREIPDEATSVLGPAPVGNTLDLEEFGVAILSIRRQNSELGELA
jgi:beta-galactosidase